MKPLARASRRARITSGTCLPLLALLATSAHAVTGSANSGALLRQNPELSPETRPRERRAERFRTGTLSPGQSSAAGELTFQVRDLQFEGELSQDERRRIDAFIAPLRGRATTLARLQTLRAEITALLYRDGETLVSVQLPPQTVENGVVRFDVVRGHVEAVSVDNRSSVSGRSLREVLASRDFGTPSLRTIERNVRRMQEVSGVGTATPVLSVGEQPGGTRVTVVVEPDKPYYGSVLVDNAGSASAGERRMGIGGGIRNPFGRGDRLDALLYLTPSSLQSQGEQNGWTRLGRLSYDTLVGLGATRVGAMYSQVKYRLGGEFAGLGKGSADVASVYAQYPLVRDDALSLDVSGSVEHRDLVDSRFDGLLESRRSGSYATLRADGVSNGAIAGRPNTLQYSLGVGYGSSAQRELDRTDADTPPARRRRSFAKIEASVGLMRAIKDDVILTALLRGQGSNRPLDASERMGLSGPGAVRAYGQGVAAVDDGAIATAGAVIRVPGIAGATVSAFYDAARGRTRAEFGMRAATVTLLGYGAGIGYSRNGLSAQASYARPTGRVPEGVGRGQFWFTLGKAF